MNLKVIYFICLTALLLALSHLSGYKIPNLANASINDALILTPYGIIKNLISGDSEFYFRTTPLRFENIWRNLAIYFPILFFSYSLILKKGNE